MKQKKTLKYKNTIVEWQGMKFRSKKELNRYQELLSLEKSGEIKELRRQVKFELSEGVNYFADFTYLQESKTEDWLQVVEDSKGYRTPVYKIKKKLMKEVHCIIILET